MDTLPFGEDAEKGNLEGRCTFLVRQQRECQVMLLQTRISTFFIRVGVASVQMETTDDAGKAD